MSEVSTSIEIDASVERVWQVVMDPSRLHEWVTIHRRLHSASAYPPRRGDHMDQTLSLHGAHFRVRWSLEVCDAPFRAEWHGRGPARSHAETEYRLTSLDGGRTRFEYPAWQIVVSMFAWVTRGSTAPGVHAESGRPR